MQNENSRRPRTKLKLEKLPAKLLAVRKHLGLSQSQLACRLSSLDIHYNRVSEYERGRRTPNLLLLLDYARLAGIHIDDLVDDDIDLPRFGDALTSPRKDASIPQARP